MEFRVFYQKYSDLINHYLKQIWEERTPYIPPILLEALGYSTLHGGKRLRPIGVYAVAAGLVNDKACLYQDNLNYCAAACELIHCYSLVHDDLPAMDNDDWRRGQLTCHKQFTEADAILVGDGLQALAFELLSQPMERIKPEQQLAMIRLLAQAAGTSGMVGGQTIDIHHAANTLEELIHLHHLKTGALFKAAIGLGARAVGCEDTILLERLDAFAAQLGLAYQIQDDILDYTQPSTTLGKPQYSDLNNHKCTFVSCLGLEKAEDYLQNTYQKALDCLDVLPLKNNLLQELLNYMMGRDY